MLKQIVCFIAEVRSTEVVKHDNLLTTRTCFGSSKIPTKFRFCPGPEWTQRGTSVVCAAPNGNATELPQGTGDTGFDSTTTAAVVKTEPDCRSNSPGNNDSSIKVRVKVEPEASSNNDNSVGNSQVPFVWKEGDSSLVKAEPQNCNISCGSNSSSVKVEPEIANNNGNNRSSGGGNFALLTNHTFLCELFSRGGGVRVLLCVSTCYSSKQNS